MLTPWKKSCDQPRQCWDINTKQRHHFAEKGPYSQSYGFSGSHVWMWELDHKEGLVPENWHFQTVVVENILNSPLDSKEIKPVNPKGNQPWNSLEGLMRKFQYFGHLMQRAKSLENTLMLGKTEGKRRRRQQNMRWMASLTQWRWVWASSMRWWRTGKPGVLQFMGSPRVGHDSDWTITTKLLGMLWYHKWHFWDISPRTCCFSPNTSPNSINDWEVLLVTQCPI